MLLLPLHHDLRQVIFPPLALQEISNNFVAKAIAANNSLAVMATTTSCYHCIWRHIMGNDTASANHCTCTNTNALWDVNVGANPDIVANGDFRIEVALSTDFGVEVLDLA